MLLKLRLSDSNSICSSSSLGNTRSLITIISRLTICLPMLHIFPVPLPYCYYHGINFTRRQRDNNTTSHCNCYFLLLLSPVVVALLQHETYLSTVDIRCSSGCLLITLILDRFRANSTMLSRFQCGGRDYLLSQPNTCLTE